MRILARIAKGLGFTNQYKKESSGRKLIAKRGYRADLGIEFKSSMEANYFRFIKQISKGIIDIEYEPEFFRFPSNPYGIGGYIPDFKLTDGVFTWFIETKGYWDNKSIKKCQLFKKYYPEIKLYVVGKREYGLIERYYRNSIKGWE